MALLNIDKKDYFILVFSNETQVIAAESFVKKQGFNTKIISIPRKVSSGCGMALRLKQQDKDNIIDQLKSNNISYINMINMEDL